MKLLIEIPKEAKQAFDCAESNDLKGCYYDHGGVIGNAIKNGKSLDELLNEIRAEIVTEGDRVVGEGEYFTGFHLGMICALKIIDKYKGEGEE